MHLMSVVLGRVGVAMARAGTERAFCWKDVPSPVRHDMHKAGGLPPPPEPPVLTAHAPFSGGGGPIRSGLAPLPPRPVRRCPEIGVDRGMMFGMLLIKLLLFHLLT